ncbi:MAG TPA: APC family permease [Clostridia bacterium]|nr:APC family permease [Clostridia bacterium]
MGNELKKKYGLPTAIAMVVGIVIGSGVFFKAEAILNKTGGDMSLGILAWIIGGLIMIACSCAFAIMATKYEYVNGIVDYADVTVGKKYGYYVGWFMATIYTPTLTGVLAWVSARYLCVLIGFDIVGPECLAIAFFFLVANYALNAISPKLGGKFQVTTTVIKLIPLVLMAIVGTVVGLVNGMTVQNLTSAAVTAVSGSPLFAAIVATAFAYEGWIIATSINAELRDAKKNLPKALLIGAAIVMAIYVLYYIGIAGAVDKTVMMASGQEGAKTAFSTIFSSIGGTILFVFIIVSCLGTLNGLMMGCTRGFYALAARNVGPRPDIFKQVDAQTNMPTNSSVIGVFLAAFWLLYFYGANLTKSWFGPFSFDTSELPIVTIYASYVPMLIMFMVKEKDMGALKRFVVPALALAGSVFMVIAAFWAHGFNIDANFFKTPIFYYLIVFVVIMAVGALFAKPKAEKK